MPPKQSYCEIGHDGQAIRIFRNKKMALLHAYIPSRGLTPEPIIKLRFHAEAVEQIRRQVFERDDYRCVHCGCEITWETGEMDERKARGTCNKSEDGVHYGSGEVSVVNCQVLCHACHQGPKGKHQRQPQWMTGSGR